VDELVTILKSLLGSFESDAEDGPPTNVMGNIDVNDEDCRANLARLKEACQPLYPCAHSTKLADTMLLMNICTIHGVNNKFVDELFCTSTYFHQKLFLFKYVSCKRFNKEIRL
jgi:hypothetical protein